MPTADYDAGCRVRSTSTKCPTRKSRTSSSPPISRPENALASRLLFRQFSKSLAKTCKSGSRKALLHLALESRLGASQSPLPALSVDRRLGGVTSPYTYFGKYFLFSAQATENCGST